MFIRRSFLFDICSDKCGYIFRKLNEKIIHLLLSPVEINAGFGKFNRKLSPRLSCLSLQLKICSCSIPLRPIYRFLRQNKEMKRYRVELSLSYSSSYVSAHKAATRERQCCLSFANFTTCPQLHPFSSVYLPLNRSSRVELSWRLIYPYQLHVDNQLS